MLTFFFGDTVDFSTVDLLNCETDMVAIGGTFDVDNLIDAYLWGVFHWGTYENFPVWFFPKQRAIMKPQDIRVHKSMRPYFNQKKFKLTIDRNFEQVIRGCMTIKRNYGEGTWINEDIVENYVKLHKLGFAHSFEVWKDDKLVGGLYGVSFGKMFFGESMFSAVANASKFAFISLAKVLQKLEFNYIDCQVINPHLEFMGCGTTSKENFFNIIKQNNQFPTLKGSWAKFADFIN